MLNDLYCFVLREKYLLQRPMKHMLQLTAACLKSRGISVLLLFIYCCFIPIAFSFCPLLVVNKEHVIVYQCGNDSERTVKTKEQNMAIATRLDLKN